jgi:hypothetical protein
MRAVIAIAIVSLLACVIVPRYAGQILAPLRAQSRWCIPTLPRN